MFFHKFTIQSGEIATTLTIATLLVLTAGIFVGTRLSRESQDVRSRAASGCVLTDAPRLTSGGNCTMNVSNPSTTLVCALIDDKGDSNKNNDTLVAEQGATNSNWSFSGNVGTVTLRKTGASISNNSTYRLVVYDWNNPNSCVQTAAYSGSDVNNLFSGGSGGPSNNNTPDPTHTPAANNTQPTPTTAPISSTGTQCAANNGQCVSSPSDCQGSTLTLQTGQGCTGGYCCLPKATPTPINCNTRNFCESNCGPGNSCVIRNGCYDCIASTPTPTPIRPVNATPTPTRSISDPTPLPNNLSCSDISVIRTITGAILIRFNAPTQSGKVITHTIPLEQVPENKQFSFVQIGLEGDTTCPITI